MYVYSTLSSNRMTEKKKKGERKVDENVLFNLL
jgi:hypothetical protein